VVRTFSAPTPWIENPELRCASPRAIDVRPAGTIREQLEPMSVTLNRTAKAVGLGGSYRTRPSVHDPAKTNREESQKFLRMIVQKSCLAGSKRQNLIHVV
jgi:hypothetical protein